MIAVAVQDEDEIGEFVELVRKENISSFLEIGSKFGGSLERIAEAMEPGSRIVSVDLPKGTKAWRESEPSLKAVAARLEERGHDVTLIWGNSTAPDVIERVTELGPYDLVFLDGDHRLPGITADWKNYGHLGRMVAFHDIAWFREASWVGVRIDVPQIWNVVKRRHRHHEIILCPTGKNNGIGVLWRD